MTPLDLLIFVIHENGRVTFDDYFLHFGYKTKKGMVIVQNCLTNEFLNTGIAKFNYYYLF